MNEKNLPTWLLVAVVVGLAELSYTLWKQYGFGLGTQTSMAITGIAALGVGVIYLSRKARRSNPKK